MKKGIIFFMIISGLFTLYFLTIWILSIDFSEWGVTTNKDAFLSVVFGLFTILMALIFYNKLQTTQPE